jgi:hypothetical protein
MKNRQQKKHFDAMCKRVTRRAGISHATEIMHPVAEYKPKASTLIDELLAGLSWSG